MDAPTIALIASAAVNAVVPFVNKGMEKLADKSAEEVFNKRAEIWNKIKGLFAEDELTTLKLFEENPEDLKEQGKLEGKLEERLKANPEVADELNELLKQIKTASNKTNINIQQGESNVNIQGNENSPINFNQE